MYGVISFDFKHSQIFGEPTSPPTPFTFQLSHYLASPSWSHHWTKVAGYELQHDMIAPARAYPAKTKSCCDNRPLYRPEWGSMHRLQLQISSQRCCILIDLSLQNSVCLNLLLRSGGRKLTYYCCMIREISLLNYISVAVQFYPPGGVLPYMGYIGMCRCEGYGFQAVYSRIGYINQSAWL